MPVKYLAWSFIFLQSNTQNDFLLLFSPWAIRFFIIHLFQYFSHSALFLKSKQKAFLTRLNFSALLSLSVSVLPSSLMLCSKCRIKVRRQTSAARHTDVLEICVHTFQLLLNQFRIILLSRLVAS